MAKVDTGVTGGAPNLLGSFTAAARPLPENVDWQAFGTSHTPENCGKPWVWQECTTVGTVPGTPCVNEVQALTITGAAGGDFNITFDPLGGDPQTTTQIAYGASVAVVQAAFNALSNVDPGDIVVSSADPANGYTFTIPPGSQYACTNIADVVADCSTLTAEEAVPAPVEMGDLDEFNGVGEFAVLAGTTVTNTGPTAVQSNLGVSPGAAVVGFPPGVVFGATHAGDAQAAAGQLDLTAAYIDAAARTPDATLPPDIGGSTFTRGVYATDGTPASLGLTGTVTLDAEGDPDAVFIFQIESTLITAAASVVELINGAQPCNVFWQVGSSATLGAGSLFQGNILALISITVNNTGVIGRLLARNGAVTLDDSSVFAPECSIAAVASCAVAQVTAGAPAGPESVGDKPLNPGADAAEFRPFLVEFNAQSCGGIPGDWEQLEARAKRGLAFRLSNAVDLALSSSAPDGEPNLNPNLPESATNITPAGGAVGVVATIAGLLQDAFECGLTGEAWIHAPAWILPVLLEHHLVTQVGSVWKLGPHTVVLDQGFANEGPTGSDPAGAGEAWIYVTGPFEYATGPVTLLDDTTRGVSPRLNRANVIAAQLALYRFDPCCVFAALAEVC